jgi:hypothetical protein
MSSMNNKDTFSQTLIDLNHKTEQYNIPLDGLVAFGTMFGMYYLDFKPLPTLITGGILHGLIHPVITSPK